MITTEISSLRRQLVAVSRPRLENRVAVTRHANAAADRRARRSHELRVRVDQPQRGGTHTSRSDGTAVNRGDRYNFRQRSAHECLARSPDIEEGEGALLGGKAQVASQTEDRLARDAFEACRRRRGEEPTVGDDE